MLTTIKGYYEAGKITLQESAPVEKKTPVIVTFLAEEAPAPVRKPRTPGSLKGKLIISDDFDEPLEDLKDYM